MRFLAGLRFLLVVAALIGLLAGRSVLAPEAFAHVAAATATTGVEHDCCDRSASQHQGKTSLPGDCSTPSCSMVAPALLPSLPILAFAIERGVQRPSASRDLEGHSPQPPLEPPRA